MRTPWTLAMCSSLTALFLAFPAHGQCADADNVLVFSLNAITEVTIAYDEESVLFYESETDELIIKEYMTQNKSGYYAKAEQSDHAIHISEGGKPLFKSDFARRVEVYLPPSYGESLTVSTTDGDIDLSRICLNLRRLRIDSTCGLVCLARVQASSIDVSSTRGTLNLGRLEGDEIRIATTSGSVCCEQLNGDVTYTTTSGNALLRSVTGSGRYTLSNSGDLSVNYVDVTGDLSFSTKNGSLQVLLPDTLSFAFTAEGKNGSVSTSFSDCLELTDKTLHGSVGQHPDVSIHVQTRNGSVDVRQQACATPPSSAQ